MSESRETITERFRDFLVAESGWQGDRAELADDTPLIDNVVDSLTLTKLIAWMENEFGLEVRDEEISLENFGTIAQLTRFVESR